MNHALITLLSMGLALGCGGGGDAFQSVPDTVTGRSDAIVVGEVSQPGPPFAPDWQHLLGLGDTGGVSSDNEALIGLVPDGEGGVYALADRRYRDDPNRTPVLLFQFDASGAVGTQKLLRFAKNVSPLDLRRSPAGDLYLVTDLDDLSLIKLDGLGSLMWSKAFDREPYAFGGLMYADMAFDSAGNIYVTGAFNPSEPGDERGYVMKLDRNGDVTWARSWVHRTFFERQRVAVGDNGTVYVVDGLEGSTEIDMSIVVMAFDSAGESIAQKSLMHTTFDGLVPAVRAASVMADGDGAVVVGTRSTAVDGDFALFIYRLRFDGQLALTLQSGAMLPATTGVFPSAFRLVRESDGAARAIVGMEDVYTVLTIGTDSALDSAFDIVRDSNDSPVIEDDDFPVLAAPGAAGSLYIGATATDPGTVSLRPRGAASAVLPLMLVDGAATPDEETILAVDGPTYAVEDDHKAVLDDADTDQDVLLVRLTD